MDHIDKTIRSINDSAMSKREKQIAFHGAIIYSLHINDFESVERLREARKKIQETEHFSRANDFRSVRDPDLT